MIREPFKLSPAFKDYLWGGDALRTVFGKQTDMTPLAESWELSVHRDGPSVVATGEFAGKTLAEVLQAAGVRLDHTYPRPIIDHAVARDRALGALKSIAGAQE